MRQLQVGSKNLKFRTGIYTIRVETVFPAVLHTIVLYGVIIMIHLPLEKPTDQATQHCSRQCVCAFKCLKYPCL